MSRRPVETSGQTPSPTPFNFAQGRLGTASSVWIAQLAFGDCLFVRVPLTIPKQRK